MTKTEFDFLWDNFKLTIEFDQYLADNYPNGTFEGFEEYMVTELD